MSLPLMIFDLRISLPQSSRSMPRSTPRHLSSTPQTTPCFAYARTEKHCLGNISGLERSLHSLATCIVQAGLNHLSSAQLRSRHVAASSFIITRFRSTFSPPVLNHSVIVRSLLFLCSACNRDIHAYLETFARVYIMSDSIPSPGSESHTKSAPFHNIYTIMTSNHAFS